jgi:hypothetical protein
MKKFAFLFLGAALLLSSTTFTGCKKGEDDPFLSFRSRASRVAGDWKLSSGILKSTSGSVTTQRTYNDSTYTEGTTKTTFKQTFSFTKDGTFTSKTINDKGALESTTDVTGSWNWVGGTGDTKNKEQIILYTKTTNYATAGFTSKTEQDLNSGVVWTLKSLKNKTMVVTYKSTNGSKKTDEGEFTFTQE